MAILLKELELKSGNTFYRLSPMAISPCIDSDKKRYYPYNIYLYSVEGSDEHRLGLGWFTEKELALTEEHGLSYLKTLLKI